MGHSHWKPFLRITYMYTSVVLEIGVTYVYLCHCEEAVACDYNASCSAICAFICFLRSRASVSCVTVR